MPQLPGYPPKFPMRGRGQGRGIYNGPQDIYQNRSCFFTPHPNNPYVVTHGGPAAAVGGEAAPPAAVVAMPTGPTLASGKNKARGGKGKNGSQSNAKKIGQIGRKIRVRAAVLTLMRL